MIVAQRRRVEVGPALGERDVQSNLPESTIALPSAAP